MPRRGRPSSIELRGALILGILLSLPPASARAQGDPFEEIDYLGPEQVLPGSCEPEVLYSGQMMICRFPLSGDVYQLDPYGGPYQAIVQGQVESRPCTIEPGKMVCGLVAFVETGEYAVDVTFGFQGIAEEVARVTILRYADQPLDLYVPTTLFAGIPETVYFGDFGKGTAQNGVLGLTRRQGSDEVIETFVIQEPGEPVDSFELTLNDPGDYSFNYCLGPEPETCDEPAGAFLLTVVSLEPIELFPGHNIDGADRINLILVGSHYPNTEAFVATARTLLGFEGEPILIDLGGVVIEDEPEAGEVAYSEFGPFATEPLRSNRHRFNFWYLPDLIDHPLSLVFTLDVAEKDGHPAIELDHLEIVALIQNLPGEAGRSISDPVSFTGLEDIPEKEGLQFGTAYVYTDAARPFDEADTVTHELAHGLFDLRDEYVETIDYPRPVQFGYPNCAATQEQAEQWWGSLVGTVDPFFFEWRDTLTRYGLWTEFDDDIEQRVRVGFHVGGCYSEGDQAIRPTGDSLMNSQIPVFGSVNRARIEEILGLWTGRKTLTGAELEAGFTELTGLRCHLGSAFPGDPVTCTGRLPPYVDPPPDTMVEVRFGEAAATCRFGGTAQGSVRSLLFCPGVPLDDEPGSQALQVSVGGGEYLTAGPAFQVPPLPMPRVTIAGVEVTNDGLYRIRVRPLERARQPSLTVQLLFDTEPPFSTALNVGAVTTKVELEAPEDATSVCASVVGAEGLALPASGDCAVLPPLPSPSSLVPFFVAGILGLGLIGLAVIGLPARRRRRARGDQA
ncbi:MAG: hypothetical protein ACE5KX_01475 [Acidimicrobiia bacterium]